VARYGLGEAIPTRLAYGEALRDLGDVNERVVVLEADIGKSTRSSIFGAAHPERYFNVGIAEQNEMVVAAGLSSCGKIPFVSTYAVFASMRACEQVRTFVAYPRANVKICPSHGGLTPGGDGPTHQATEDLGIMRTIPNMTVCMPTDATMAYKAVFAAADLEGPLYLRLTRDGVPVIYDDDLEFEFGKAIVLETGPDATLIALGDMVSHALEAARNLASRGVRVTVIDMHTIKPLDAACVIKHCAGELPGAHEADRPAGHVRRIRTVSGVAQEVRDGCRSHREGCPGGLGRRLGPSCDSTKYLITRGLWT